MPSTHHALRFRSVAHIRQFFLERGFQDVLTPIAVEHPGMETHLHPFQVFSSRQQKIHSLYLHTSPEFAMKELMAEGYDKIFTINYCFRDEPRADYHRNQFLMLEWYRAQASYELIQQDTQGLVEYLLERLKREGFLVSQILTQADFEVRTVADLFSEYVGLEILDYLTPEALRDWILDSRPKYREQLTGELWPYEDYFFLLFLNEIEPELQKIPKLIVKDYPAPLSALSSLAPQDPRVCQRFELYLNGVEVANCFQEETSSDEIQKRFAILSQQKKALYQYQLPSAERFFHTMKAGLPHSSGIALGVERLAGLLTDQAPPFWD